MTTPMTDNARIDDLLVLLRTDAAYLRGRDSAVLHAIANDCAEAADALARRSIQDQPEAVAWRYISSAPGAKWTVQKNRPVDIEKWNGYTVEPLFASAPPSIAGAGWKQSVEELISDLSRWDRLQFGGTKQHQDGAKQVKKAITDRLKAILASPVPDNTDARGAEVKVLTVAEPTLAETLASRHKALMLESEREASAAAQVGDRERQSIASTESERHRAVYHAMCLIVADQSCAAIIPGTDASGVIERYDQIIAKCAQAVGAGIAPQASMEFKELLPGEIAGVVGKLREALTRLERCTRTIIGGLAPGQSINNDAGHTNTLESAMNEAADLLDKLRALDPVKAQKP